MRVKREATIEDLEQVEGKAELVNGELVLMPATGALPGYAGLKIGLRLHEYAERSKTGHPLPDNVGFIVNLPNRHSFSPDISFYQGPLEGGFPKGAPIFAVEVRSQSEYGPAAERKMAAKRADYFAAGTLVVWDVDVLRAGFVRVYRASAPETPTVYRRGETAEAEPALPGWTMPVDELFPAP